MQSLLATPKQPSNTEGCLHHPEKLLSEPLVSIHCISPQTPPLPQTCLLCARATASEQTAHMTDTKITASSACQCNCSPALKFSLYGLCVRIRDTGQKVRRL